MNVTLENGFNSSIPFISSENYTCLPLQTAMCSINLALVLPINSYVLWLILRGAGGTIASEFFYLNLTVSVMIYSLLSVVHLAWIFTHHILLKIVVSFFVVFFCFSVPSFQCCICVERYMAVVHPVGFLRYKALRYRVGCCCAVWAMVLAFSFGFMFDVFRSLVLYYIFLGFFIVLASVMSFCCLSTLRALKQPGPGEGQRDNGKDMKRRAFRIILICLIVMLMTYLPYILTAPLKNSFSEGTFPLVICITYSIVKMSGLVHPLLYLHRAGKLPCFKGF